MHQPWHRTDSAGIRGPSWNDHQGAQVVETKVDDGVSAHFEQPPTAPIRSARLSGSEGWSKPGQSWRRRVCTRRLETAGCRGQEVGMNHLDPSLRLWCHGSRRMAQPRPDAVRPQDPWLRDGPVPASARPAPCRRRVRPARCRSREQAALRVQLVEVLRGDDERSSGAPQDPAGTEHHSASRACVCSSAALKRSAISHLECLSAGGGYGGV